MGFPIGYSELFFPKLLLHIISFFSLLRRFISWTLFTAGLGHLIDSETQAPWSDPPSHAQILPELTSASASLILEFLPVGRFDELLNGEGDGLCRPVSDCCAVCLYEFEACEEVRWLSNCRHVFHRGCLDRWVVHDQRTCPLCRTPLIPDEMQDAFEHRLWAASGEPDSFSAGEFDYFPFSAASPSLS